MQTADTKAAIIIFNGTTTRIANWLEEVHEDRLATTLEVMRKQVDERLAATNDFMTRPDADRDVLSALYRRIALINGAASNLRDYINGVVSAARKGEPVSVGTAQALSACIADLREAQAITIDIEVEL